MDLQKAKIYLDKINREFGRMNKDPENVARIDLDIMLSYIRDLYDAFLSDKVVEAPAPSKPEPGRAVVPPKVIEFSPERPKHPTTRHTHHEETPASTPVVSAPPPPPPAPAPPPVEVSTPVAPPPPPPPVAPAPAPPEVPMPAAKPAVSEPVVQTHVTKPTPAPSISFPQSSPEAELLFEQKQARELSEKLAERPIEDLKRGIALNDRLLFTRELFGNNNQAFDDVLTALNSFSGFEQAKAYLLETCVGRFDWMDKSRAERAKEFIRLVRRRYK